MAINFTKAYKSSQGTVSTAAVPLTSLGFAQADIDKASQAFISCLTNAIYFTYDGVTMGSVGHPLNTSSSATIVGRINIINFQAIRQGSSDATVYITLESAP